MHLIFQMPTALGLFKFFLKIILSELVPADGASSDPHSIGAKTIRGRTALAADWGARPATPDLTLKAFFKLITNFFFTSEIWSKILDFSCLFCDSEFRKHLFLYWNFKALYYTDDTLLDQLFFTIVVRGPIGIQSA